MKQQRVWRLAVAGNATVLFLLMSLFAQGPLLFTSQSVGPAASNTLPLCPLPSQTSVRRASQAIVIVVDALRLDSARDRQLMPTLSTLARHGGFAVSVVETLIPSTVAAIQALVAGVIVSPLAFVDDFAAPAAKNGGIFAAIHNCNGHTFVAGPRLWTDLYGAWITDAVTTSGFAEEDERLLAATIHALERNRYQLTVVHFSRPDHAAHQYGASSAEYARALRWCDAAIAQIVQHVTPSTAVFITADHGVTRQGGHAGLEPVVRLTPLVTWGPGVAKGALPVMPQATFPLLLQATLQSTAYVASPRSSVMLPGSTRVLMALLLGLAAVCVQRMLAGLSGCARHTPPDALLNATIWVTLLLSYYGNWQLALGLSLMILVVTAWRFSLSELPGLGLPLAVGCLFGSLRLLDGVIASEQEHPDLAYGTPGDTAEWSAAVLVSAPLLIVSSCLASFHHLQAWFGGGNRQRWCVHLITLLTVGSVAYGVSGWGLLAVALVSISAGYVLGRSLLPPLSYSPGAIGTVAALIPAAAARFVGETVSLSTIDVTQAFMLAESSVGLPGAVLVTIARQALLSVGVCLSLASTLCSIPAADLGRFAAGFASTCVAQSFPALVVLFMKNDTEPAWLSLALGTLVHLVNEVTFCFLTLAAGVFFFRRRLLL